MNNYGMPDVSATLAQIQNLQNDITKMQQKPSPVEHQLSSYPRSEKAYNSVDAIVANQEWRQQLEGKWKKTADFQEVSKHIQEAINYSEIKFHQFCEIETGYPSNLVAELTSKLNKKEEQSGNYPTTSKKNKDSLQS